MAARVTPDEVENIFTEKLDQDTWPAIHEANTFADEFLVPEGVKEALLKIIVKYLAAHLAVVSAPRTHMHVAGQTTTRNEGNGRHRYLERAIGFDPTGLVARHFGDKAEEGQRRKARLDFISGVSSSA